MKKIVYIISTLKRTGPTNILAGTALNLDKKLFKPAVITLSPEEDEQNSWKPELEKAGIEVRCLNLSRLKGFLYGGRALKRAVEAIKPDIVHSHCFRSSVFSAFFLTGHRRLVTVHSDFEVDFRMMYGRIQGFLMSRIFAWALKKMDKRVSCSAILANSLNKKYPKMEFIYVNNGVNTKFFYPVNDKNYLRKNLALPQDKTIFMWAGSFIPVKNPITLVQVIKQLPTDSLFFVFCGANGPLLETCTKELETYKNVKFAGYVNNIREYMQASDFYISTSLSEGLPCAVLEAISCGLIPLLSNIPQHTYILPKPVLNLCIYKTKEELIKKINNIMDNFSKFILVECKKNINNFSAETMSREYQKIYDK